MLPLILQIQEYWYKTDTKLYVPTVTLSPQDNVKLLKQLKSGIKWITKWNKYLWKVEWYTLKDIFRLPNWSKFSRSE